MEPNNSVPQPVSPPNTGKLPAQNSQREQLIKFTLFLLAAIVLLGMLIPQIFGSILIYPLAVFAILAIKNFHDDTKRNVSTSSKAVHTFKLLVKVGGITVAVIFGLAILLIALLAQSGV